MPRAARLLLPLLLVSALTACNTDAFGMKPEVPGVEIPQKPAAEPASADEAAEPA